MKGGRDKSDDPLGGGLKSWTWSIIFKIPKTRFVNVLGTFNFWVNGGAKNIGLVVRG